MERKLENVENIEEMIDTKILFENGTYEIYTSFKGLPTTYANLFVDTKRHQYFIELSTGELSAESGVKFLVERLKDNFVNRIAECTNKESLIYRANPNAINLLCGPTILDDRKVMKSIVELFRDCSLSYTEKEILEETGDTLGFYPQMR